MSEQGSTQVSTPFPAADGSVVDRSRPADRAWLAHAVRLIEADMQRSADTHLLRFPMPRHFTDAGIDLYLKDESTHVTGSLKHRLARSLFLYALCNGALTERTTVIESSSGSTAVSEAYFARMIGLPFVAVMPSSTSPEKIALIQAQGGRCHLVDDPAAIYAESHRLAAGCGGHYMDQFTYAERATDWRGNNNIAESIFAQLALERHPIPEWVVVGAGTGGTSATIGRYLRYRGYPTRLCVADPEGSAFFPAWRDGDPTRPGTASRIEGIGRPRVEPSFVGPIVDRMQRVPDAASVAMMRELEGILGRRVGPSTGTSVWACFELIGQMRDDGVAGSIVTLLCDSGDRYAETYFDDEWVARQGWDLTPFRGAVGLHGGAVTPSLLDQARSRLPELLADLELLVRCESPSADLVAVGRSADLVAQVGEHRLGVRAGRRVVHGRSHLSFRYGAGPVRVLLLAHHDTVWPVGSLSRHPWSNRDGVIRGPGTVDMKAGLVMGVHALALLADRGVDLTGACLLVTGDEEIGSPSSRQLIEDHAWSARGCLVLEGAGPGGALKTGRKGTSWYRIEITGRAAHAGGAPEKGINAAVELAHLILTVNGMGHPERGTTVTPTVVSAGTTTNTVPAAAELHVDVRARTAVEQQRVHAAMRSLTPTVPGATLAVHGEINRPPMDPAGAAELFATAVRLAERDGLGRLAQRSVGGGSDGNFTAALGVPTLDGLGAVGGGAHAADEHVLGESLAPRTALLAALVEEMLGR